MDLLDTLSQQERSERMSRVRSKNTQVEIAVRSLVHRLGYRYGLQAADLPGRPDMVFRSRGKVLFIHGCFWHRHVGCKLARIPKSRLDFWVPKLEGNKQRDARNQKQIVALGWDYIVVWECELREPERLADRIKDFLEA
jgi:DNA mismatch endonuclease (patch repair protein)